MAKAKKKANEIDLQPNTIIAGELENNQRRIRAVLPVGRFTPMQLAGRLTSANVLELMVCLNDMLQKAADATNADLRVRFTDDVTITDDVKDVTDLINKVRNAVVHISSKQNYIDSNKVCDNMVVGQGCIAVVNGHALASDYVDDIALFYGQHRIYLKRHILRAFNEVTRSVWPYIGLQAV